MFIAKLREKLRRGAYEKTALAKYTECTKRGADAADKWREIPALTQTMRDNAWEMFFEYTRGAIALTLLRNDRDFGMDGETRTVIGNFAALLYPHDDYAEEIVRRIGYIFERAAAIFDVDTGDRYTPLDELRNFRQMLSVHLWMKTEIDGMLEKYPRDYADAIRRELVKMEFDQSRCEVSDPQYIQCERSYNQILNRPAAPTPHRIRSPREIRAALKDKVRSPALLPQDAAPRWSWKKRRDLVTRCRNVAGGAPRTRRELPPKDGRVV